MLPTTQLIVGDISHLQQIVTFQSSYFIVNLNNKFYYNQFMNCTLNYKIYLFDFKTIHEGNMRLDTFCSSTYNTNILFYFLLKTLSLPLSSLSIFHLPLLALSPNPSLSLFVYVVKFRHTIISINNN